MIFLWQTIRWELCTCGPRGFVKIRYFGLWANRYRSAHLAHCRELLAASDQADESAAILTSEQRTLAFLCQAGLRSESAYLPS